MIKMLQTICYTLIIPIVFFACSEDTAEEAATDCPVCPETESALTVYAFDDADGNSTVSYPGQVVRNLIITDMTSADAANLTSMYDNE